MRKTHCASRITDRGGRAGWLLLLVASFLLSPSSLTHAQNETPPPGMRITFLPPPMEGTLSLGIYDKKGKLVRVMAREATEKNFTIGLNGLITFWDGKDDSGKVMPPGIYSARGYSVGAVGVEGVAYHGNDWVADDDAPRIRRIRPGASFIDPSHLRLPVELADGNRASLSILPGQTETAKPILEEKPELPTQQGVGNESGGQQESGLPAGYTSFADGAEAFAFGEGKLLRLTAPKNWEAVNFPDLHRVIFARPDTTGIWLIDEVAQRTEVKQYSFAGELLRRLKVEPNEPPPRELNGEADVLYLLEENEREQRVRILLRDRAQKTDAEPSVSLWKTATAKSIRFSDSFDAVKDLLRQPDGKPFKPESEFIVHLINNPLLKDEPTTAHVNIGFNGAGSFLQTTDGLPLRRVTETPGLKWAVIGREGSGKLLTIFQSDGAVVEEFRARRLASMMAFDAGEYEWTGK